ncbi:acid protease [Testicularia cyperi]|uniref:Acid protease n=1 Tax=Testicularia cyperi TaxID=1882483 RepID=A0A317XYL6_9BASI|nr:acid protease [Testicularia cyperi]
MKRFSSRFLTLLLVLLSIGAFDLNILLSSFRGSDHGPISTSAWHSVSAAPLPSSMGDIDVLNSNLQARSRNPRVGVVVKPGSSFKVGSGKDAASSASSYTTATSSSSSSAFENADGRVGMKVQLKRLERNPNANPLMLYQRHLNRANAKLASILGRRAPSQADMDRALQRRRSSILSKRDTASLLADNRKFTHPRQGYTTHRESGSELQRRLFGSMLDGLFGRPSDDDTDEQSQKKGDRSAASAAADPADGYPEASVNASMSDNLIAASDPTAVQSLGLDIEANDIGYVATIQIGSQDTSFRMLIDSGSADTWVPSSSCADCGSTHQKLGRDVSSTFVASNTPFSIQYGTGSVSGNLATDDLEIAGLDLTNYTFAVTTEESSDFSDPTVPFDGLMGLAKSELSNAGQPTPIDALYAEDKVQAPVMGYHLGRVADGYNDGEVTFGGVDAAKYQGSLTEIPNVSDSGFWEAAIDAINVGGDDLGLSGRTAILDTGTTLIVAPESDADAIHAAIPGSAADGQGGYTIPCTTSAQVTFTFGGTAFPIDTRDLLFLPLDENDLTGDCVSAISAGDVGQRNQWLLGATFLKNVYFATNSQADAIGLGMLATENSTSNGTDTDGN